MFFSKTLFLVTHLTDENLFFPLIYVNYQKWYPEMLSPLSNAHAFLGVRT